jgi:hypothetical protein
MTIINDDSRVINKFKTLFTDDVKVVIYNRHMIIVQAIDIHISSLASLFNVWAEFSKE